MLGFIAITRRTGQAEVGEDGLSTGGTGNDMLDFKSGDSEGFSRLTIGAAVSKMRADLPPQLHRNINTHAVVFEPVWLAKV